MDCIGSAVWFEKRLQSNKTVEFKYFMRVTMRFLYGFVCWFLYSTAIMPLSVAYAEQPTDSALGISSVTESVNMLIEEKFIAGAIVMVSHKGQLIHLRHKAIETLQKIRSSKRRHLSNIFDDKAGHYSCCTHAG